MLRSQDQADALHESFYTLIQPVNSWKVTDSENGLRWTSSAGADDEEPAKSDMQRIENQLLRLLPISKQL